MFFLSCQQTAKKNIVLKNDKVIQDTSLGTVYTFYDTALQNKIVDTLFKLPIIKKSHDYIDSFSNHKHGIAFLMDTTGNAPNEVFIQAGYSGELRFETYYQIYVNSKSMEIKFYDPVNDKKLSIKEFEKINK
jgi:hypothetical protein